MSEGSGNNDSSGSNSINNVKGALKSSKTSSNATGNDAAGGFNPFLSSAATSNSLSPPSLSSPLVRRSSNLGVKKDKLPGQQRASVSFLPLDQIGSAGELPSPTSSNSPTPNTNANTNPIPTPNNFASNQSKGNSQNSSNVKASNSEDTPVNPFAPSPSYVKNIPLLEENENQRLESDDILDEDENISQDVAGSDPIIFSQVDPFSLPPQTKQQQPPPLPSATSSSQPIPSIKLSTSGAAINPFNRNNDKKPLTPQPVAAASVKPKRRMSLVSEPFVQLNNPRASVISNENITGKSDTDSINGGDNKSSLNSSNTEGSISARLHRYLNWFWEIQEVRYARFIWLTARFSLLVQLFGIVLVSSLLIYGSFKIPNLPVPDINSSNAVHITANFLGHILVFLIYIYCSTIKTAIMAVKLNKRGVTLAELSMGTFSTEVPGSRGRQLLFLLALLADTFMLACIYNFQFELYDTSFFQAPCIPATYLTPITPQIADLGNFLQGDTDLAVVYDYALPLGDGLLGGWSSWPLASPGNLFYITGMGIVYAMKVECYPETTATTAYPHTIMNSSLISQVDYSVSGDISLYYPANSSTSSADLGKGIWQSCQFSIVFGTGSVSYSFAVDEWLMAAVAPIIQIEVPGVGLVQQGSSYSSTYSQFVDSLNSDEYGMAAELGVLIAQVFDGSQYQSSQGALFCNLMQWGTLPDGFYHTNITWKGTAAAIGSIAHFLLMQYDGTQVSSCLYYGEQGAGRIIIAGSWTNYLLFTLIALLASVLLMLAWLYLTFPIDIGSDLTYHLVNDPVLFAFSTQHYAVEMFGGFPKTVETLPDDILAKIGDTRILYGIRSETVPEGTYQLAMGQRKEIVSIRKILGKKSSRK